MKRKAQPYGSTVIRWAVLWRSENRLGGRYDHYMYENQVPALFTTRRSARTWIDKNYGYIRTRPDLKREPHGWKIPVAIRCTVNLRPLTARERGR